MTDFVIVTGDMVQVTIPKPALVPLLQTPVPLIGSATAVLVNNRPVCLQGDELPAPLAVALIYVAPPYVTPGMGTLALALTPANMAAQTTSGRPLLIKGTAFQALFKVVTPAMMPTPGGPVPDPMLVKPGTAQFITANVMVRAG